MKLAALIPILFFGLSVHAQANLEQGLALSNADTLKSLEHKGFSFAAMIGQDSTLGRVDNKQVSEIPVFKTVLDSIVAELNSQPAQGRKFDQGYLTNPGGLFALVGIINRADRGYQTGNRCGEIRFIYRLAYTVESRGKMEKSRLPMTFNLVYRQGLNADNAHCADVANAWLKTDVTSTASDWIDRGPLNPAYFDRKNLIALELNMQTDRSGAASGGGFGGHAIYLMKVYKWDGSAFQESTLENQISRSKLQDDPKLLKELKEYLFDPANAKAIDDGTLVLPGKFLAKKSYSFAPGGIARSANRQYYGLVKSEEIKPEYYKGMTQVKSADGFIRRLNDTTCTGCHQTRAIGGFHFPGRDPFGKYPGNSIFMPGSAHYFGDLTRRRLILNDIAANADVVDFSRGFSARPQASRAQTLEGSGLYNGWGAHCSFGDDASFKSWTCSEGFVCKKLLDTFDSTKMGICRTEEQKVGDPCEFGKVKNTGFGQDKYTRLNEREVTVENAMCSPQSQDPGTKTGGFLGGNVRKKSCEDGPGERGLPPEAACGLLPAAKPGFNACLSSHSKDECLAEYSLPVGMRGCDQKNPCRDDYICAEGLKEDRGVCVPPYFIFQFRVDGHPKGGS